VENIQSGPGEADTLVENMGEDRDSTGWVASVGKVDHDGVGVSQLASHLMFVQPVLQPELEGDSSV